MAVARLYPVNLHPLELRAGPTALTVVIPAYNEEEGIADILEQLLAQRAPLAAVGVREYEILVVDDGSKDRTAAIVAEYPEVRLVRHETNRGYGAALKTGFAAATHDWVAFLDADATYPPECLPALCTAAQGGEVDLIVASRMSGEYSEMPAVRRLGNFLFANMLSVLANRRISDSASGMRLFHRDILGLLMPLPDGLHFTPAMSTVAVHENLRIREVPIPYKERAGRSKLGVVRDGWRFFWAITWNAMLYNPLRLFAMIGLALLALGVVIGLPPLVHYLEHRRLEEWYIYRFYFLLLLGVASVSLLTFGLALNAAIYFFNPRPIRQGFFVQPVFTRPPSVLMGVAGGALMALGALLYLPTVLEYFTTLHITRHWSYLSVATMLSLMGLQLALSAVLIRVLTALRDHADDGLALVAARRGGRR